jgi:hypothetical protein
MKRILNSSLVLVGLVLSVNTFGQNSTTGQILPSATPCDKIEEAFTTDPAIRGFSYSGFYYVGPETAGERLKVLAFPYSDYIFQTPMYYLASGGTVRVGCTIGTSSGSNDYFKNGTTLPLTLDVVDGGGNAIASYNFTITAAGTYCFEMADLDITAGTNARFRFIFQTPAGVSGSPVLTLDNFTSASNQQIILPVTFLSFTAAKTTTGNLLTWKVTGETNVARYEIERSSNGKSWTKYNQVTASLLTTYTFLDAAPLTGSNYYRIKAVDVDLKYKYTAIVVVKSSSKRETTMLRAYPSPAASTITVEHDVNATGSGIQISSVDGRVVRSLIPAKDAQQTQINVSRLAPGMYFIRFENALGEVETIKFVKQ